MCTVRFTPTFLSLHKGDILAYLLLVNSGQLGEVMISVNTDRVLPAVSQSVSASEELLSVGQSMRPCSHRSSLLPTHSRVILVAYQQCQQSYWTSTVHIIG